MKDQVLVGSSFEDLILVALWRNDWLEVEPALWLAFSNWQDA